MVISILRPSLCALLTQTWSLSKWYYQRYPKNTILWLSLGGGIQAGLSANRNVVCLKESELELRKSAAKAAEGGERRQDRGGRHCGTHPRRRKLASWVVEISKGRCTRHLPFWGKRWRVFLPKWTRVGVLLEGHRTKVPLQQIRSIVPGLRGFNLVMIYLAKVSKSTKYSMVVSSTRLAGELIIVLA